MKKFSALSAILLFFGIANLQAQITTVYSTTFDSGFSTGVTVNGQNGWTVTGAAADAQVLADATAPSQPNDLQITSTSGNKPTAQQGSYDGLSISNAPGTTYTLSMDVYMSQTSVDTTDTGLRIAQTTETQSGQQAGAFSIEDVYIRHDGTVTDFSSGSTVSLNASLSAATWYNFTFVFNPSAVTTTLTVTNLNDSSVLLNGVSLGVTTPVSSEAWYVLLYRPDNITTPAGDYFGIDNISLQSVPEPRSLTLLTMCFCLAAGAHALNRRRQMQAACCPA